MNIKIEQKIIQIINEVCKKSISSEYFNLTLASIIGIDSFDMIQLGTKIDVEFDIKCAPALVIRVETITVNEILDIVSKELKRKNSN